MRTILVADDDVITRKVVKGMCESLGYRVIESPNGQRALDTLRRHPVEIVITDWLMPGLDGLSLCEKLHAGDKPSPFVFLITGKKKGLKNYAEALGAGADDFLYKPVDFFVFRNQLRAAEEALAGGGGTTKEAA
jgi:CheY-like chemotaxis protein